MTGCGTNSAQTFAAWRLGVALSGDEIPRMPDECYEYVALLPGSSIVGVEARSIIKTYEKKVIPAANAKLRRCVHIWFENLRKERAKPAKQ